MTALHDAAESTAIDRLSAVCHQQSSSLALSEGEEAVVIKNHDLVVIIGPWIAVYEDRLAGHFLIGKVPTDWMVFPNLRAISRAEGPQTGLHVGIAASKQLTVQHAACFENNPEQRGLRSLASTIISERHGSQRCHG